MVGKFCSDDPLFEILYTILSLFYASTQFDLPPPFAEKISLSLSHLVDRMLVTYFTNMYYFVIFMHFVLIFCLILDPVDPLFH